MAVVPAPPQSDPPACYLANLAALYRRDAELAARIDALPFADLPPLEPARDGWPTARVTADDGQAIYLHSRYRPREEARQFVEGQPACENPTFLIAGLGLGYHLPEFERNFDRPLLIVAEDEPALIKAAMCLNDLSALLEHGRLIFVTRADRAALHERLFAYHADLLLGTQLVALPHTRRVRTAFYQQLQGLLADFLAYCRLQMVTMLRVARVTVKNISFNLPAYLQNPGVDALRGRAAGWPAIVVAAGPSLAGQLETIRALSGRAVIIAVQTVFKLLRALDVRPHFVCSLDFHEVSAEFFEGLEDVGDCILVAEPKAAWRVLDLYHGRKHVLTHGLFGRLIRQLDPPRGGLKPGSTVAHLAFYLAQHLGCDPIILVGQDLCYSDGLYYPPGTPVERIWAPELGRFCTLEMKQWERIVRNRPILKTVTDVNGRETYTDDQLYNYAEQFKVDFASAPQRIIHAGNAGMRLAGTEVLSLTEAAERFCTRPLPGNLFAVPPPQPVSRDAVCGQLQARAEELARIREIAQEIAGLLEQLSTLTERPEEFNRVLVRVDELRTLLLNYEEAYQLVVDVSQIAELRRYSADRRLGKVSEETAETARRRLARDREFVREFLDGCDYLERLLPQVIERVRERLK
jgi:hypothetical protein